MSNKQLKFKIDAPATQNKVKSMDFTLDESKGNAFRIEKIQICIPDLDAVVSTDSWTFQISTQDQNENAALYDIESEYEILTIGEGWQFTADDPLDLTVKYAGKWFTKEVEGIFITANKFYLNQLILGQDGAIVMYVKVIGQYVNLKDISEHTKENTF
jgi:hypothetical protein